VFCGKPCLRAVGGEMGRKLVPMTWRDVTRRGYRFLICGTESRQWNVSFSVINRCHVTWGVAWLHSWFSSPLYRELPAYSITIVPSTFWWKHHENLPTQLVPPLPFALAKRAVYGSVLSVFSSFTISIQQNPWEDCSCLTIQEILRILYIPKVQCHAHKSLPAHTFTSLLLWGGMVKSVPCTAAIVWSVVRPHLFQSYLMRPPELSGKYQQRHIVAKQEETGEKFPLILLVKYLCHTP
jgi:hypothetical protein